MDLYLPQNDIKIFLLPYLYIYLQLYIQYLSVDETVLKLSKTYLYVHTFTVSLPELK